MRLLYSHPAVCRWDCLPAKAHRMRFGFIKILLNRALIAIQTQPQGFIDDRFKRSSQLNPKWLVRVQDIITYGKCVLMNIKITLKQI